MISRGPAILNQSLLAELSKAIAYCQIAKRKGCGPDSLPYLLMAEATSAKFLKLHSQGKIVKSKAILQLMLRLEEALGGQTP